MLLTSTSNINEVSNDINEEMSHPSYFHKKAKDKFYPS